jgi:hypothetical protein
MEIVFWLVLVVLAAWFGTKRKLGGGWTFIISLFLSPLVGFIAAIISGKLED